MLMITVTGSLVVVPPRSSVARAVKVCTPVVEGVHVTANGVVVSAALWCAAFAIFPAVYYPILTRERLDGQPG